VRRSRAALALVVASIQGCATLDVAVPAPKRSGLVPLQPLSRTVEEPFRRERIRMAPRPDWTPPAVTRWTLRNGMPVYFIARPGSGAVAFQYVNRRAGNRDARVSPSLPMMLATMLGRGTLSRPGIRHAVELASLGAELEVDCHASGLYASVLVEPRATARAAALLADAIVAPELTESEFRRAKDLLFSARSAFSGQAAAHEIAAWTLFGPAHPLARPSAGTAADINATTIETVLSYARQRLIPAHSAVVIAGDIDEATLRPSLEESFGRWTVDGATAIERAPSYPAVPLANRRWSVLHRDLVGDNAHVFVAYSLPALLHQDFASALVLNHIVGAHSGRMNRTLREQQNVTYGAYATLNIDLQGGYGIASTTVDKQQVGTAIDGIFEAIQRLRSSAPRAAELEAARERARTEFFARFESLSGLVDLGSALFAFELGPESWTRHLALIDQVTGASVQHVALEYLSPERVAVSIIGDSAAFARALTGGARPGLLYVVHQP
jgi:zinc protease